MISVIYNNNTIKQIDKKILKISTYLKFQNENKTYEEEPLPLIDVDDETFEIFNEWFKDLKLIMKYDEKDENMQLYKPDFLNKYSINQKIKLFNFALGNQIKLLCETIAYNLKDIKIFEDNDKKIISGEYDKETKSFKAIVLNYILVNLIDKWKNSKYDFRNNIYEILENEHLKHDGIPSGLSDEFIKILYKIWKKDGFNIFDIGELEESKFYCDFDVFEDLGLDFTNFNCDGVKVYCESLYGFDTFRRNGKDYEILCINGADDRITLYKRDFKTFLTIIKCYIGYYETRDVKTCINQRNTIYFICDYYEKLYQKNKNIKESKFINDYVYSLFINSDEIRFIESLKLREIVKNEVMKLDKNNLTECGKLIEDYKNKYSDLLPKTINEHLKLYNLDNCRYCYDTIIFKKLNNKLNIMRDKKYDKIETIKPEFIIKINNDIPASEYVIENYLKSKNVPFESHENFITIDYKNENELIELFKNFGVEVKESSTNKEVFEDFEVKEISSDEEIFEDF